MKKNSIKDPFDPKEIEKSNKAFWKMSKKKQRIAVAQDALKQLKLGIYVPKAGTYCMAPDLEKLSIFSYLDLQAQMLSAKPPQCHVCGIGSLFVSMARLGDKVSYFDSALEKLPLIFSDNQIDLIEGAFEGWGYRHAGIRGFYNRYPDPTKRMNAILRNIIRNEGIFVIQ
jgi:hypothetical protein